MGEESSPLQINSFRPMSYAQSNRTIIVTPPTQPSTPIAPPPATGPGRGGVVGDFWFGMKYGGERIIEFIKHPFDESKREGPWRNPCLPESTAEKIGRWVPGALVAVAGFLIGKAVFRLPGGGAHVGWR